MHSQHVSLTFQHACLDLIFSPISALTFHPMDAFAEHTLGNQTRVHCVTCVVDAWFWTRGHGKTVLSFCLECDCESKLLVVRSLSTEMNLKRLASEKRSAATLFSHFPLWFKCLVLLFHFDDGFRLRRICMFVLDRVGSLASFWT